MTPFIYLHLGGGGGRLAPPLARLREGDGLVINLDEPAGLGPYPHPPQSRLVSAQESQHAIETPRYRH